MASVELKMLFPKKKVKAVGTVQSFHGWTDSFKSSKHLSSQSHVLLFVFSDS